MGAHEKMDRKFDGDPFYFFIFTPRARAGED
jgi:hypothetical protein